MKVTARMENTDEILSLYSAFAQKETSSKNVANKSNFGKIRNIFLSVAVVHKWLQL